MADHSKLMTKDSSVRSGGVARFDCPFDTRLARCPYLVLPKLALQSMPFEWRDRFEAMLAEMDATGLETPAYIVLRDDGPNGEYTRARVVNDETGFVRICGGREDPWANYRHGKAEEVCPGFKRPHDPQSWAALHKGNTNVK